MKLLVLVGLPVFSFKHLKKNFNRIVGYQDEFELAFGTLYQGADPCRTSSYQMNTIFCVRRLFVALFTIFYRGPLVVNLYVNIYSSLWIIKFYFKRKPMKTPTLNKIEILNEIFYLFCNYFMIIFTDFIPDVEFRY